MPFTGPQVKRGRKRRIVIVFRGRTKSPAVKQLARAVQQLVKKHNARIKKIKKKRG
ncbi:MAG TPA: hypothetical protein VKG64_03735 [Methylomirabilota bacterium]|jgi:hypothetical protein|nr:hypothetical protein [Methylomirabilota bacterium]